MKAVKLFGVHGSGKTTTGKMMKKYGFKYVKVDPMDDPFVRKIIEVSYKIGYFGFLLRQFMFVYSTYTKLNELIDNFCGDVVIDFSPLQTVPYTDYFIENRYPKNFITSVAFISESEINSKLSNKGYEIYDVLFFVYDEKDIGKIRKRILSRKSRPENIRKEEARKEYIEYINNKMRDIFTFSKASKIVVNAAYESNKRLRKILSKLYEL